MAKNNGQKKSSNTLLNTIITVVMVVVIGISVYAIYSAVSTKVISSQIESGQRESTLAYMAKTEGVSVDEFIEKYGLKDAGLSKNSSQTDVIGKMTLTNYATFAGTTVEEILKQYYLEDKADENTLYADFEAMWTVKAMVQGDEESFKQLKEYYSLDDSITMDTLWSEVEPIIEAKIEELQNATPAPSQEADAASEQAAEEATDAE